MGKSLTWEPQQLVLYSTVRKQLVAKEKYALVTGLKEY